MALNLDLVVTLIKEIDREDTIDWAMLNVSEDDATRLLAGAVIEHFHAQIEPMPPTERDYIIVAAIAKLTLENFVLNLKLEQALRER